MQIKFENFPGNLSFAGGPFARKRNPFIHCQLPEAIFHLAGQGLASVLNPSHLPACTLNIRPKRGISMH